MREEINAAAGAIEEARRIVVKVGSSLIAAKDGINRDWLRAFGDELLAIRQRGVEIIIVSSGAVALGRQFLPAMRSFSLEEKQTASAIGQALLIEAWRDALKNAVIGQILLTLYDTEDRKRYLNARATLNGLIENGAVPVINENDAVATAELRYGDNDRLAAHAAVLSDADLLLIFSDVDGLFDKNPMIEKDACLVRHVRSIDNDIRAMAGGAASGGHGSGGMATKIAAAEIASAAGISTIIASGRVKNPFQRIIEDGPATLFSASQSSSGARRRWINGRLASSGAITIDAGAEAALRKGASLLPAGVVSVSGEFLRGDAITIKAEDGEIIARGLATYDSDDLSAVAGASSDNVYAHLGYRRRPAVVERRDLVLINPGSSDE